ncbi:sugar ABC transporter substrate-binding protein [Marmoricola endophyticus]|uniref:Sugar ABC transporter substrate-binding protein n=1 Tax=Marmoricola endophyticus TaxID=2040280 RepID=A0A917F641_9ACTN|nr:substrate-binding domain-containing protein [Marmoricola endophyticus]GGF54964.1 sugar ABC transporter substrate-binding protein [Marmoricola endophyticus]
MSIVSRRVGVWGAALALGATPMLAACGSSDSGSGSGADAPKIEAACKLDSPPTSKAEAPSTSTPIGKASGKVGVILPDTTSSTRYTLYDKPLLEKTLGSAGIQVDVQNAQGDVNKFASIAQSMIGSGVKVLMIDSIDAASGAGVEKEAAAAGVDVIDYDRVNLGGTAGYYVSYDNEDIGRLQAQTLVDCLDAQDVKDPKIIMMNGGTDVDNNAVLFSKGAHAVLDPLQKDGKLEIAEEATVKGWKVENAAPAFNQALTAAGGNVQGVLAANDDIANAVIGVLKNQGLDGHVVLTGQDSSVAGLQNVLKGTQSMTINKKVQLEADAASRLAVALLSGKNPSQAGLDLTDFDDPQSPSHKIKAVLLPAQVITQDSVKDAVKDGGLDVSEVCKGLTKQCSEFGVS